jgi:hypothetical protein
MDPALNDSVTLPGPKRAGILAVGAAALTVAAIASYPPLMDVAWIRSTGAPVWIGFALAAGLAVLAIRRDRRIWVRGIAGLTLALIVFGVVAFFGLARLPRTSALDVDVMAPEVSVVDHRGEPVALREASRDGPILLVFYRGFW